MWTFTVTDLKQHTYCPRIVYYTYCLPLIRPTTYKMQVGIEAHDMAEGLERRRSLRAYGLQRGQRSFDVLLISERLGLSGKVDMVIRVPAENGSVVEVIPVEYKHSPGRAGRHLFLQLTAYALMLEEMAEGMVRRGFLYFIPSRQAREVPITPNLRGEVIGQLQAMREMVERERMPEPPRRRAHCVICEFRRFCNDV